MSEQTTERDELADLIETAVEDPIYNAGDVPPSLTPMVASAAADAVLAANYRKPRTVTTVEELDALPVGSVILGKWLAQKWADPDGEMWHIAGKGMYWDLEQMVQRVCLHATVLHEGDAA